MQTLRDISEPKFSASYLIFLGGGIEDEGMTIFEPMTKPYAGVMPLWK